MKDVKSQVADKRYEKEFQEYLASRKSENYEYPETSDAFAGIYAQGRRGRCLPEAAGREKQLYQRISEPYILDFYPGQRAV
jgi:hypothetical protein